MCHTAHPIKASRWFSARSLTRTTITNFRTFPVSERNPAPSSTTSQEPTSRLPALACSGPVTRGSTHSRSSVLQHLSRLNGGPLSGRTHCLSGQQLPDLVLVHYEHRHTCRACVCACVCESFRVDTHDPFSRTCVGVTWLRQRATVSTVTDCSPLHWH